MMERFKKCWMSKSHSGQGSQPKATGVMTSPNFLVGLQKNFGVEFPLFLVGESFDDHRPGAQSSANSFSHKWITDGRGVSDQERSIARSHVPGEGKRPHSFPLINSASVSHNCSKAC